MLRVVATTAALVLASSCAACGDDEAATPPCSASELAASLGRATSGDVVSLGACRIEGSFEVPAGVTLRGAGRDATVIASSSGSALRLLPGDVRTVAEDLSVESGGTHGIVALGAGSIGIMRVQVRATRGIGVGAEGLTEVALDELEVLGPVTRDNVAMLGTPTPETTATHGIALLGVGDTSASATTVRGFAVTGVLVVGGRIAWSAGGTRENYGIGLHLHRAEAVLAGLDVGSTFQVSGEDTFGAILSDGSSVASSDLQVSDNGAYGILVDRSTATFSALRASANGRSALRLQQAASVEVTGASELRDNAFASIVAVGTPRLVIDGATIGTTRTVRWLEGEPARGVEIGDGVQLVDSSTDATIRHVVLERNERVGLLVDSGGGSADGVRLEDVRVSGEGEALGVVAQASIVGPNWDSGVTRDAVTAANDVAFSGALDVVGIVGPNWTPPIDRIE